MKADITITPPSEPTVEIRLSELRRWEPVGSDGLIITVTATALRAFLDKAQSQLAQFDSQLEILKG